MKWILKSGQNDEFWGILEYHYLKRDCFKKMEIGTSDNCIYGLEFLEADKIMNVEEYENINRLKKGFYMIVR